MERVLLEVVKVSCWSQMRPVSVGAGASAAVYCASVSMQAVHPKRTADAQMTERILKVFITFTIYM
jgi:homoserine kinase